MMTTVEQHVLQQRETLGADVAEALASVMGGVALAARMIAAKIRAAGLSDLLGAAGAENVQGEQQQKLDVFANDVMAYTLGQCQAVSALVSEEDEGPVLFERAAPGYVVLFDPLDGSSNIDVNVNVGTIFGVLRRGDGALEATTLAPGTEQVMSGYVLYGPSTVLVYTVGRGVHSFTLDSAVGAFVLSAEELRMPEQGSYYSANEATMASWPEGFRRYVRNLRAGGLEQTYSSRYIGSLVGDFHRTLLKGGVFLYPPTSKAPRGKLRLLYEANPLAWLVEQAGGLATNGADRVLAIRPEAIHERTAFCFGGRREMDALLAAVRG